MLLKYFRDIASADLNALFPDVRVVMGLRDQLILGVPALVGGIPILLKLASTLTVLFLVAGFYLGLSSAVKDDEMAGALAAVGGLVRSAASWSPSGSVFSGSHWFIRKLCPTTSIIAT